MNAHLFRLVMVGGVLAALSAALGEVQPTMPDPHYPIVLKEPEETGPVSVMVADINDTTGKLLIKISAKGDTEVKSYHGAVRAQAFRGTNAYAETKLTPVGAHGYRGEIEAPCGTNPMHYPSFSIRVSVDYKVVGNKTAEFKSFEGVAVQ